MGWLDLLFALTLVPVAALWWAARSRGRRWAGIWLLTLAPLFVPMAEDGFLAVWFSIATPAMDPHGVRGVVHGHALGHLLGAGLATICLSVVLVVLVRGPLAEGRRWAWRTVLGVGLVVSGMAVVHLAWFFGHGLPTAAPDGGGFGWPFWVTGLAAWSSGLWLARPGPDHDPMQPRADGRATQE